uniref:Cerberus family protein n=1 Tax=Clytia hemisphaerica TaxID=252671 RepID=A0A7M5X1L6_9CNID|eukprot:TCONS_00054955-protein
MDLFAAFFMLVWVMEATFGRPSTEDIPMYNIGGKKYTIATIDQFSNDFKGKCKLHKAHMEFGVNRVVADFCGGGCEGVDADRCIACQPTPNGKKSKNVTIIDKKGISKQKTIQVITACHCAKVKDCVAS